jgi:hypothetical protein
MASWNGECFAMRYAHPGWRLRLGAGSAIAAGRLRRHQRHRRRRDPPWDIERKRLGAEARTALGLRGDLCQILLRCALAADHGRRGSWTSGFLLQRSALPFPEPACALAARARGARAAARLRNRSRLMGQGARAGFRSCRRGHWTSQVPSRQGALPFRDPSTPSCCSSPKRAASSPQVRAHALDDRHER